MRQTTLIRSIVGTSSSLRDGHRAGPTRGLAELRHRVGYVTRRPPSTPTFRRPVAKPSALSLYWSGLREARRADVATTRSRVDGLGPG